MTWGADWTVERKALVKRLWGLGYTASQVAAQLDIKVTRNAVIGLVHRNRWAHGVMTMIKHKPRKPHPRKHVKRPVPRAIELPPRKKVPAGGLTIFDLLDHHCRWPAGEKPPFRYCGREAITGSSYCTAHHRQAHSNARSG